MTMRCVFPLAIVMAGAGCSRTIPGGGVMVVLRTDDTLHPDPDLLTVGVGPAEGGTFDGGSGHYVMDDASIPSPGEYSFPVSFGIDSNGDPSASVNVVARVYDGTRLLETRRYLLQAVPTDKVVELDVLFTAAPCVSGDADRGLLSGSVRVVVGRNLHVQRQRRPASVFHRCRSVELRARSRGRRRRARCDHE